MIKFLFPLLFSLFLFLEPVYLAGCSYLGLDRALLFKSYLAICFVISLFSYLSICKNYFNKDIKLFILLGLFAILYVATSWFYGYSNDFHTGHLLRWGAQSVPALLMGISFCRFEKKHAVNRYLAPIIFVLTPFIALASLRGGTDLSQYTDEDTGLTYQRVSYYMAFLFGCTSYLLFLCPTKIKFVLVKLLLFGMLAFQGLICAMSGGRGGFVLLCCNILYILYALINNKTFSKIKLTMILVLCSAAFLMLSLQYGLFDSAGFERVINPVSQQIGRTKDWEEVLSYFWDSPLWGNGLGSDFYTWGFYSHNMFVDFLAETGIIGFIICVSLLSKMELSLYRVSQVNPYYQLVVFVALWGLIENSFTGYWVSTWSNWMIIGVYWANNMTFKESVLMNRINN